jgi:hypothetical protein
MNDNTRPDPEVAMQEPNDWLTRFMLFVLAAWIIVTDYFPVVLLAAFYAAITSATAIIIIHHLSL